MGEWAKDRIGYVENWGEWYQAIGLERRGVLIAGCVFNFYTGSDISVHIASDSRRWATHEFLRACFGYPFHQLKVRRLTGYVPSKNAAARKLDEHLGFRLEGVKRDALPDDDLCIYGMTRAECRWL